VAKAKGIIAFEAPLYLALALIPNDILGWKWQQQCTCFYFFYNFTGIKTVAD